MTVPLSFIQEDEMGEYGYMNLPAFLPVSALFSDDNTIGVGTVSSTQQVSSCQGIVAIRIYFWKLTL